MRVKTLIHRYLSVKVLPIWTILLMDIVLTALSCLIAYILRYDIKEVFTVLSDVDTSILWCVLIAIFFYKIFRTYSGVLRYSSFVDIMRIFVALSCTYAVIMIISIFSRKSNIFHLPPYSVIFISYIINFGLMTVSRMVVKILFETLNFDGSHSANVFIYGAKEAGVNIAKSLRVNLRNHYKLKGFIADEPKLIGKVLMGVKVYANDEELFERLSEKDIQIVIISPAKMNELKKSDLADKLLANNIKLMTAPPLSEWKSQTLSQPELKEIQIEDLLQREPIQIDIRKVASHLEGKRVMITGAAGSIGSEIMRQVASFNPYTLILVDQAETPLHDIRLELQDRWRDIDAKTIVADIANQTRMESIFKEFRPQYIFHAAAYKHVPMMEDNVSESIQTNVAGTRIVADLAVKYKAEKFVMISTDKAVNPTNVMGCSKRICEIYVQSLAKKLQKEGGHVTQFITTRFGNVLGSNGSVIPRFKEQIKRGGPVTVTHPEIIRYFMTIPEACRLVLEAGSMGNGGEIYIFDMGKPVKILDLAKRMISLSGRPDIKIEFTGLRHGEKLYEELLNVKELTKPTYHEKIMIATVREYDYDEVKDQIQHLIDVSYTYNQMKVVEAMKNLVPEFISKNSCFEALDKNK
ncbi:UDP-glucose 4-epimerase [uncultured Bacteroides sp.]|uniref:polysaccharide biosynthesis protein n=1 Tax=Bacteroides cellulolyticus TaxID=2981780 RepID=UPI000821928F|nr:nucleoside-diphosphate sugar epimerase/dehydratase [Bacteroides cellulolyticus]MCU6770373.1 polysaccharide biosynthesis protein [Bacteroides cellulolyticus]SCH07794.1 UDP-glucose 4-epimerase [uncultured Bacteroides sp.]